MRYLITGAGGFVGKYLHAHIVAQYPNAEIMGVGRHSQSQPSTDLHDYDSLVSILKAFQPHRIIHLASSSSVGKSWEYPIDSFSNNVNIFLNLIEAVRKLALDCKILSIGSSEQYGIVSAADLPLSELSPVKPISPYAVARYSQEMLSEVYARGYGLQIIATRSFNHFGPGQKATFALASFAKQLVTRQLKNDRTPIRVGDISIVRDFIDVRDVARIYCELLEKENSFNIYNICSGTGRSLEEILKTMMALIHFEVPIETDNTLIRPLDNPRIVGDNRKIGALGIDMVKIPFEQSLRDILTYWKEKIHENTL